MAAKGWGRVGLAVGVGLLAGGVLAAGPGWPQGGPARRGAPGGSFLGQAAGAGQADPRVVVDDRGGVYRVWVDQWDGQGRDIRFQRSADGGMTWLPEALVLDRDKPADGRSTAPRLLVDGSGRLLTLWRTKLREGGGRKELRFLSSPDRGASWPGPPRVLNRGGGALEGDLATDGQGRVYAAWYDERLGAATGAGTRSRRGFVIYFNRSEDGGQSWLAEDVRLSGAGPEDREGAPGARRRAAFSAQPRIQADRQGRVVAAWVDNREGRTEVYVRVSEDRGRTWGPELNVSRGASSATDHQLLTDGEGRVYLVWTDARDGLDDVFFARSEDGGRRWEAPVRLSRRPVGATLSTAPHLALGPRGHLYVAWQDRRHGREDVYLNLSRDYGRTWLAEDLRLDRDDAGTGVSRRPFVAVGPDGRVAVAWDDDRSGFGQILLTWSADGGRTWLDREVRVDTTTGPGEDARGVRLAWDPAGRLHAAWEVWAPAQGSGPRRVEYRRLGLGP